jgi:hypothetical protein
MRVMNRTPIAVRGVRETWTGFDDGEGDGQTFADEPEELEEADEADEPETIQADAKIVVASRRAAANRGRASWQLMETLRTTEVARRTVTLKKGVSGSLGIHAA